MFAGFDNKILRLSGIQAFGKDLSQAGCGDFHRLPLVGLFLAHKELDHILRQRTPSRSALCIRHACE